MVSKFIVTIALAFAFVLLVGCGSLHNDEDQLWRAVKIIETNK